MQSREYKYDRHAFDLKARLMPEKYAKAGTSAGACGSISIGSKTNTIVVLAYGCFELSLFHRPTQMKKVEALFLSPHWFLHLSMSYSSWK